VSDPEPQHRCGYVAIAGIPNVGKSTLLNALMGLKLSIIAPRPQSTRRNVLGILNGEDYQAVLVDTPGLLDPRYRLQAVMRRQAVTAIAGADVLLLLLDAPRGLSDGLEAQIADALDAVERDIPVVLAPNKVDRVEKSRLLPLIDDAARYSFAAVVPISALKHDGLDALLVEVIACLPPGPPLYPPDVITEHPERFFVAELVREVIFHRFGREIPYAPATRVEQFRRVEGRKTFIEVQIVVERESQRPILLGKGGRALKAVGTRARQEIEAFLDEPVYLELRVKVREEWRNREAGLRALDLLP